MSKRANGEGSVYKRKKDGRWTGKLKIGYHPNGTPKYKAIYGSSQKEVIEKLNNLRGSLQNNSFVDSNKITFGAWLDNWLNVTIKSSIKNTTWLIYENLIRTHIKPVLGGIKLQQLKTSYIQELYNRKLLDGRADKKHGGLSPKTIKHMHQVIRNALTQAMVEGLISKNPAEGVRLPKVQQKEMQILTPKQIKVFLHTAKTSIYHKRYYAAFVLELYTGLRRGELLGLRWKDVDFKEKKIIVVQQVTIEGGTAVIRELKTDSSQNRTIAIPPEVIDVLIAHKKLRTEDYNQLGFDEIEIEKMTTEGLVFTNELGTGLVHPRRFLRNFKGALKLADLPDIRFHDLRHTFAALSLQQGVDIKTLQSDLGHDEIATTLNRYGHVNVTMKNEAARKRSKLLKKTIDT